MGYIITASKIKGVSMMFYLFSIAHNLNKKCNN